MRILGNIIWLIPCFGIVTAFFTFILGAFLTVIVIPAPIGLGLMQLAKFELAPFSYEMISKKHIKSTSESKWETYSKVIMLFYIPLGCLIVICAVMQMIVLCITIIGIPIAVILAKSLSTYFNPVNKICVPRGVSNILADQKAQDFIRSNG